MTDITNQAGHTLLLRWRGDDGAVTGQLIRGEPDALERLLSWRREYRELPELLGAAIYPPGEADVHERRP